MTSSQRAFSQKKKFYLSLKNGMNSLAFSSCPIYKSYIGQTNRKRNESALLVWATRRRQFICSGRSRGLLSITRHHYTQRWRYSEEGSQIHRRINNISVKSCEMHSNSAQNSVKATDIRTNATDVETRKNIVQ